MIEHPWLEASPYVQLLAWTLVHFVWEGALIGLCVYLLLRRSAAAASVVRYGIGVASLVAMLLVPAVTFLVLVRETRDAVPAASWPATAPSGSISGVIIADSLDSGRGLGLVSSESSRRHAMPPPPAHSSVWSPVIVLTWTFGVGVLSLRLAGAWFLTRRYVWRATLPIEARLEDLAREIAVRLHLRRSPRLAGSAMVDVPTVVGCLKPVVLLPMSALCGLSPAQLEAILAHELAHVRRHDYLVNLLQSIVETLLFYHPAVWWISARVRAEREHCCDDLAVEACGDRVLYVSALAALASVDRGSTLAMAASDGSLVERVSRLLGGPGTERELPPASAALLLAGLIALGIAPTLLSVPRAGVRGDEQSARRSEALPPAAPAPNWPAPPASPAPAVSVPAVPGGEPPAVPAPPEPPGAPASPAGPQLPAVPAAPAPPASPAGPLVPAEPAAPEPPQPPAAPAPPVMPPAPALPAVAAAPGVSPRPSGRLGPPPAPPALPAPPAPPAPPSPRAPRDVGSGRPLDSRPPDVSTSIEQHITTSGQSGRVSWSNHGERLDVRWEGRFQLGADDRDVTSIESGGRVTLSKEGSEATRVELRGLPNGQLERKFSRNGVERSYEPEGREWLATTLLELVQRTGLFAEQRVARLLNEGGVDAVLARIERFDPSASYACRRHYEELLHQAPHTSEMLSRTLEHVSGRDLGDYDRGLVLTTIAGSRAVTDAHRVRLAQSSRRIAGDDQQRQVLMALLVQGAAENLAMAILDAAADLQGDHERGTLLIALVEGGGVTRATSQEYLNAAGGIRSAYQQRRVLSALASMPGLQEPVLLRAVAGAAAIESDHEQRQVLSAFLGSADVTPHVASAVLASLGSLSSGYERSQVLHQLLSRGGLTPETAAAFFSAADSLSDYEHRRLLDAVSSRGALSDALLLAALRSAGQIASAYEQATALTRIARNQRLAGAARALYVEIAERIGSGHEQTRALAELTRADRRAR